MFLAWLLPAVSLARSGRTRTELVFHQGDQVLAHRPSLVEGTALDCRHDVDGERDPQPRGGAARCGPTGSGPLSPSRHIPCLPYDWLLYNINVILCVGIVNRFRYWGGGSRDKSG